MMEWLTAAEAVPKTIMIDATDLKVRRTASRLRIKKQLIGRIKNGMNTKLHAVSDLEGRYLSFFMTTGQVNDCTGAAAFLDDLPKAQWLLGDRGYDADWFRDVPEAKSIQPVHFRPQIAQRAN